jgi:hypothetical protein
MCAIHQSQHTYEYAAPSQIRWGPRELIKVAISFLHTKQAFNGTGLCQSYYTSFPILSLQGSLQLVKMVHG